MRWLKPREMVFFDLLESAAANAYQASQLFDLEIRTGDPVRFAELRRQMKDLEHIGDDLTREIMDRLNQTFVTPIEREDIMSLAHALDDVVDSLHAVCERLISTASRTSCRPSRKSAPSSSRAPVRSCTHPVPCGTCPTRRRSGTASGGCTPWRTRPIPSTTRRWPRCSRTPRTPSS
ncbi:MAG: DUF47 family protein [Chitinophagaceae bacterium]|nr:DUF47 family protein [Chitinophagaceae bacterium]